MFDSNVNQKCVAMEEEALLEELEMTEINNVSVVKKTKYAAYKNLCLLSLAFLFLFTAADPLQDLQTSIHNKDGLGFMTLFSLHSALAFFSLFLPNVLLKTIGHKYTMVVSLVGYFSFILANFFGTWWTLIPTAILLGICSATIWCAEISYVNELAREYSDVFRLSEEKLFSHFYPIFHAMFGLSQVSGCIISSSVIQKSGGETNVTLLNTSCGALFCPSMKLPPSNSNVTRETRSNLVGIYIGCACVALIFLLLLSNPTDKRNEKRLRSSRQLLVSTIRLIIDKRMLLMSPILLFSGAQSGFLLADFTEAYVTCYLGVDKIGWVMISFGLSNCGSSIILGMIGERFKTFKCLLLTTFVYVSSLIWLLKWESFHTNSMYPYILLVGIYGLCSGSWSTQIPVTVSHVFHEVQDEAYSLHGFWEAIGFTVAVSYGNHFCIKAKLYITIVLVLIGIVGTAAVEYMHHRSRKWRRLPVDVF